jgi:hypothetical protein
MRGAATGFPLTSHGVGFPLPRSVWVPAKLAFKALLHRRVRCRPQTFPPGPDPFLPWAWFLFETFLPPLATLAGEATSELATHTGLGVSPAFRATHPHFGHRGAAVVCPESESATRWRFVDALSARGLTPRVRGSPFLRAS